MNGEMRDEPQFDTRLVGGQEDALDVEVVVQGATFKRSLRDDLAFAADEDIDLWLMQQPGKTAYWRIWLGRAKLTLNNAQRKFNQSVAKARLRKRQEDRDRLTRDMAEWGGCTAAQRNQSPKPVAKTVDEINAEADLEPEVELAWQALQHAQSVYLVLEAGFKAIDSLRSTLTSVAANARSEIGSFRGNRVGTGGGEGTERKLREAARRDQIANDTRGTINEVLARAEAPLPARKVTFTPPAPELKPDPAPIAAARELVPAEDIEIGPCEEDVEYESGPLPEDGDEPRDRPLPGAPGATT